MSDLDFFRASAWLPLGVIAAEGRADVPSGVDATQMFRMAASLARSGPNDVTFLLDEADLEDLVWARAGACFIPPRHRSLVPALTVALVTERPLDAFTRVSALHLDAVLPPTSEADGIGRAVNVHGTARFEQGVIVDPSAVVGPRVEIGTGTRIGPNSVICAGVRIGRKCVIDAHVSIRNALIGDRVLVQAGARIGSGALDIERARVDRAPRLGRVIVQDEVEIEANAVVECHYAGDTVIGDKARLGVFAFVKGGTTIGRCAVVEGAAFPPGAKMV